MVEKVLVYCFYDHAVYSICRLLFWLPTVPNSKPHTPGLPYPPLLLNPISKTLRHTINSYSKAISKNQSHAANAPTVPPSGVQLAATLAGTCHKNSQACHDRCYPRVCQFDKPVTGACHVVSAVLAAAKGVHTRWQAPWLCLSAKLLGMACVLADLGTFGVAVAGSCFNLRARGGDGGGGRRRPTPRQKIIKITDLRVCSGI